MFGTQTTPNIFDNACRYQIVHYVYKIYIYIYILYIYNYIYVYIYPVHPMIFHDIPMLLLLQLQVQADSEGPAWLGGQVMATFVNG